MKKILRKKKQFLLLMLVFLFTMSNFGFIGLVGANEVNVATSLDPGEVAIDKTAQWEDEEKNIAKVTLEVIGEPDAKTSDIILVIDRSGSMGYSLPGTSGTRLDAAKAAAIEFVNTLLAEEYAGLNRIAVVSFGSAGYGAGTVTTNAPLTGTAGKATLVSAINSLAANGGTTTQAGIRRADSLLTDSTADNKVIVLLADGQPTFSYEATDSATVTQADLDLNFPAVNADGTALTRKLTTFNSSIRGTGNAYYYTGYNIGTFMNPIIVNNNGWPTISEALITKHKSYVDSIYTIGFALDEEQEGQYVMKHVASSDDHFYETADDLSSVFAEIAGSIISAGNDAVIEDIMGYGSSPDYIWELIKPGDPDYTAYPINVTRGTYGLSVVDPNPPEIVNIDKITWKLDAITAEPAVLTYYVRLRPTSLFSADDMPLPTNSSATITYDDHSGQTQEDEFPIPGLPSILGSIQVQKTDENGALLKGAGFTLYLDEDCTIVVADEQVIGSENPAILFENMVRGNTYYMKETTSPPNYVYNPGTYKLYVNADGTVSVWIKTDDGYAAVDLADDILVVENTLETYPVGVTKLDAVSEEPLAGVVFGLYDGNDSGADLLEQLPATNASGYAQSTDSYAPDTYYLKEISTIGGYQLNTGYHAVTVNIGQAGGVASITVDNDRTPYPVGVTKLDAISEEPLAGVVFGLYDSNDSEADLLEQLPATNASGYAQSTDSYAPGTYYLKEITPAPGYELNPDYHLVTVNINQSGRVATITVDNDRTPYPVGVIKLDAISEEPIAGVIFGLYDGNDSEADLLEQLSETNASGYAQTVNNYAPGTYYLKEISTINGYELNPDFHLVTVNINQDQGQAVIYVANERTPYQIQILKLDQRDGTTPLEGAVFELKTADPSDGNGMEPGSILEELTTDANGQAITTNSYAPGYYFLVETQAPQGFHLLTEPLLVTLAVGAEPDGIHTVTIINNFINLPSISVSKQVGNLDRDFILSDLTGLVVGETARYEVVVTNNGNSPLADVTLTDDMALVGSFAVTSENDVLTWQSGVGGIATLNLGSMATGESVTLTYDRLTEEADLVAGVVVNTVVANGSLLPTPDYPEGLEVSDTDSAVIIVSSIPLVVPGLEITKEVQNLTAGGPFADFVSGIPGDTFRYRLTIRNTGNIDLVNVWISDDQAAVGSNLTRAGDNAVLTWAAGSDGKAILQIGDLAAGESVTLTYDYTVAADAANLTISNTATVEGTITDDDGPDMILTDDDSAIVSVVTIPQTGERSLQGIGAAFILIAAAYVFRRLRRMGISGN